MEKEIIISKIDYIELDDLIIQYNNTKIKELELEIQKCEYQINIMKVENENLEQHKKDIENML